MKKSEKTYAKKGVIADVHVIIPFLFFLHRRHLSRVPPPKERTFYGIRKAQGKAHR